MYVKVNKVINNNLVRSYNEANQEILVMGCGLGYKKRKGDEIDTALIEKMYKIDDKSLDKKLTELIAQIPLEHIQVANRIISYATQTYGRELNDMIYVTLTDHINYAIERNEKGIYLRNALLWEIKKFYQIEYSIGIEALKMIKKELGVELPEDEAGYIAIHLVNASANLEDTGQAADTVKMIQHIIAIVKYHFHMELDEDSLAYERFLTHLKFFTQRAIKNEIYQPEDENFVQMIKNQFPGEYKCSLKIKDYFLKEYNIVLSEEELIYLTVHIKRVTN